MTRERLAALCRVLIGSGDMTPTAERMLLRAWDEDSGCAECMQEVALYGSPDHTSHPGGNPQ